jgi:hypothetical protein
MNDPETTGTLGTKHRRNTNKTKYTPQKQSKIHTTENVKDEQCGLAPSPKKQKQKQTMKKKPKKTGAYPGDHVEKIKVDELNRALVISFREPLIINKQTKNSLNGIQFSIQIRIQGLLWLRKSRSQ